MSIIHPPVSVLAVVDTAVARTLSRAVAGFMGESPSCLLPSGVNLTDTEIVTTFPLFTGGTENRDVEPVADTG